jgi:hypothetical protein
VAHEVATFTLLCSALHHLLPALTIGNVIHLVTLSNGEVEMRMRCCPKMLARVLVAVQDRALTVHSNGGGKPVSFAEMADHLEAQRQALNLTADRVFPDRRRVPRGMDRRAAG